MVPAALLLLLLLPANLSSTLLQTTDPVTGETSRWEGWVGTVQASGLPEGARASLVDILGDELPGSAANATGGTATLPVVSRLPGIFRLAVNGTATNETLLLSGSYLAEPPLRFEGPGGAHFVQVCVTSVRNSEGQAIPGASRDSIPVSLDGAGARTEGGGCALLPAPAGRANATLAGLSRIEVPVRAPADGILFSAVDAGGQAARFFERGFLRAVRITAASDIRNFTLVVEPRGTDSLSFWSRSNSSGVARLFLVVEGLGSLEFCRPSRARESTPCTPLPALSGEGQMVAPLPGFGVVRMKNQTSGIHMATLPILAAGAALASLIVLLARRRRPPAAGLGSNIPRTDRL